ncbi:RE1 [Symbiodinium sp. CCMP2592]|nr:RE1 [Symbiodinium sp. CCMP2592]
MSKPKFAVVLTSYEVFEVQRALYCGGRPLSEREKLCEASSDQHWLDGHHLTAQSNRKSTVNANGKLRREPCGQLRQPDCASGAILQFGNEHHHGYLSAFGAGKGDKGDKNATVTTGAAESSGSAAAAKAAPKAPSNQPTTKGDVGKGTEKGVRTFLEGAYFGMPMVAPSFVESGEKIYWLLDSGSSYHVVSQATLESGHVKVLSRKKRPKTVCQTATGDLVEVGSDTHATIEVNFLTTRHFEQRGGVLSTFACTCRLEAEVLLPAVFGDCAWLQSVMDDSVGQLVGQSSCDSSGVQLASAKKGWTGRAEAMEISSDEEVEGPPAPKATGVSLADRVNSFSWTPPYIAPEGKWSSPQALSHNNRNYCEYCMVCGKHATEAHLMSDSHNHHMKSWIARNRPGLRLLPDRLSDPERIDMMIQLRMPDLAEPEIKKARELVLQLVWFSNQPAKADASTLPPEDDSEATAKSSNALPGIWAEPPEPPRAVERRVLPSQPEPRRVKARRRPWPDTLGVQLRSTQQLEKARVDASKFAYGFGGLGCLEANTGWPRGSTATDTTQGSMMPKTPPKTAPLEAPAEEDTEMAEDTGMEQEAPSPPNVSPCAASGTSATTRFGSTNSNIFVGATQLPTSGCSAEFAQRRELTHEDEARHLYGGRSRLLEGCSGDGHRISASASAHRIADPTSCSYREPAYFKPNGERSGATTGTATGCATTGTSSGNVGYQPAATSAKETFSQPDPVIVSQLSKPEEDPLNQKNHNKEPDTQPEGPAGLGLAAGQGELIMSQDPETRRELHKRLSHVSQGHVPYLASCEACNRSRGLTPARMRSDRPDKEYQVDQFMYRSRCFIILVHVLAFAIGVTFRPEGMSGRESAGHLEPWLAHFGLGQSAVPKPSFYSDPEPLTISIAQALAERYEGHSESFAPERHAPVAERAVRTLKGIVSSHELQVRENGVVLGDDPGTGTLEFLFRYAAHVHNRFAVSVGSTMSPLQKLRGHDHKPQLTYPFGAVVFAKVSRSSKEEIDSKYARGVYLGPVLGSTGHQVRIRLDSGETKLIVAPGLKLLYPLRYDASLLDGARPLEGFVPPLDEERFRELHLPYVPGGGPSKEWIREHGGTPKCPGCSEEATSSRHSIKCVRRYQRWLRDAVDNALEELGRDPPPAQGPPAKRVRFGDSEVREFPAPSAPSEQEVEVPQIGAEANDHLSDYEPSLPSEDEGKDDLMGVTEAPKDDRPAIRLLEEMWACGCVRYVPTPLTACDVYDLQAFCSLLVDGRSSCDKLPYSCIALLEHERVEHDVGRPRSSYDDVDGIQLDNKDKESWEGMKTEVKAVDSLQVGLLRSRSEVDRYQEENPGCRVIKSRWVLTQKAPGLVRARLVAKDFAHGKPSALDLGLSSNTASVEALKLILSRAAKGRMRVWGLDISTAFLFANVVRGGTAYLILEKALYGLRSASLSWQRHLGKIMVGLGLKASPLEPTLFSGWVQLGKKWTYIIALAYVDDLLIVSDSQEGVEFIHKSLSAVLKVKVTGRLHEDGQLEFLGRLIKLDGNNITLGVKPEYVRSVFSAFGWTEKDLAKVKPVATTPDIRALYDAEDPESPSPSLSPEAAGRFRSCLGKIGWLTQTRTDITYFHSMLSRGQAAPRMVHEDALRKFLRWLVGCPLLDQVFPAGSGETLEEECATLVAFCDSNWGSESSTGRKSTSGGVIYVVAGSLWYCVKGYSRLQTVVALSSAEAELFAIAEEEIAGLGQLASHIWGEIAKPLAIYTDSASARQIAGMEGFLRRMRHVDIRLCFIQDRVHQNELVINGVAGEENVSDLLTKNLNIPQTSKHTTTLGLEDVHQVDLCAVPVVRSCVFLTGLLNSIFDNTELEWERFLGLCELPTSYGTLFIEFWEVDGTSPETVERLMSAMDVARSLGMKVVLWSSTPCTGGSPWQRKHLHHNPQHQEHLQALFTVHRKLWKSWLKLNTHPQVSVWVIEWPQRCSYWGWQSTKSFLRSRGHHEGLVHGCMAGMVGQDNLLVKKTWKLVSNDADFIQHMSRNFACDGSHDHSQTFDLKATQHYPRAFAETALATLRLG